MWKPGHVHTVSRAGAVCMVCSVVAVGERQLGSGRLP